MHRTRLIGTLHCLHAF